MAGGLPHVFSWCTRRARHKVAVPVGGWWVGRENAILRSQPEATQIA